MNVSKIALLLLTPLLFACQKNTVLSFRNTLDVERPDEVMVITRDALIEKAGYTEGFFPVFRSEGNTLIPSQTDDMDGDGQWDEVALLLNFPPNGQVDVKVEWVESSSYPPVFEKRTNLRLGIVGEDGHFEEVDSYQALPCSDDFRVIAQGEGVNWENDRIGFRNYFDCRNVKDLFGKRLPEMIIDRIHTPELGDYHTLADWGMDVLHCGSSLGAGGIALLKEDSLFRLGFTEVYEYCKISEGPVRSVFELRYDGWEVDGDVLAAVERISIYPGKYWFESDVTVQGAPAGSQIVTGIVTSHLKKEPFSYSTAGFTCVGTHDVQSLNSDELGMAVLVPADETGKIGQTSAINFFELGYEGVPEKGFTRVISETCYIGQKFTADKPAKHYFFSAWGLDREQWKTEEGFRKYIDEESQKLTEPVMVL